MGRKLLAVLSAALGLALLAGPQAYAAEAAVTTASNGSILWVEASVTDASADSVTLKIFSPRDENGRRQLWQRCSFEVAAAGDYHCGIDISGSVGLDGLWVARAIVDGELADSTWFRT